MSNPDLENSGLVPRGMTRFKLMWQFSRAGGAGLREKARLFYYSYLKPSLVFRGIGKYQLEKRLRFRLRTKTRKNFQVQLRDNQLDMITLVEFFSTQHVFIPQNLPPYTPKVIYDIGANIGIASLYFATHYPTAQFFGFEPVPSNHDLCQANFENLPGGKTFPWAIGAKSGTAEFEFDENDLRGGHLNQTAAPGDASTRNRLTVSVVSLDDLVAQKNLPPPDFVKIDIEGAELAALAGIQSCRPHIRRILIETHGVALQAGCIAWLNTNGFAIQNICEVAPGFASIWADQKQPT